MRAVVRTHRSYSLVGLHQRLGDVVGVVERAVEAEVFYPQESPMKCSSCSYHRECRGWRGPGSLKSRGLQIAEMEEAAPC
jgi:hypothetical protein